MKTYSLRRGRGATLLLFVAFLFSSFVLPAVGESTGLPSGSHAAGAHLVAATATATPTLTKVPTATTAETRSQLAAPRGVALGSANLRTGPGVNYAVKGSLRAGDSVALLGRSQAGTWLLVKSARGEGWVLASLLKTGSVSGLPVAVSTAPTVAPLPTRAATPKSAASTQAGAAVACGASVPAPSDLKETGKVVATGTTPWGDVAINDTEWSWRWDGEAQVKGVKWYFDAQLFRSDQPGAEVVAARPIYGAKKGDVWSVGRWQMLSFFQGACGGQQCPLFMRLQVAMKDSAGKFVCFISAPSNLLRVW